MAVFKLAPHDQLVPPFVEYIQVSPAGVPEQVVA